MRGEELSQLTEQLRHGDQLSAEHVVATIMERAELAPEPKLLAHRDAIDQHFGQDSVLAICQSLARDDSAWAQATRTKLMANSPLALAISLELVRRGRSLSLADDLRLERNLVHWCFEPAWRDAHCETVEGVRALAIDKDHQPRWSPANQEDVSPQSVQAMFESPWAEHPLAQLR